MVRINVTLNVTLTEQAPYQGQHGADAVVCPAGGRRTREVHVCGLIETLWWNRWVWRTRAGSDEVDGQTM